MYFVSVAHGKDTHRRWYTPFASSKIWPWPIWTWADGSNCWYSHLPQTVTGCKQTPFWRVQWNGHTLRWFFNPTESFEIRTYQRLVHYRVYEENGEVVSKTSFDENDSSLGRINILSIPPPHDVVSSKARLSKAKGASGKGAPAIECRTYSRLVSPGLGPKKKKDGGLRK